MVPSCHRTISTSQRDQLSGTLAEVDVIFVRPLPMVELKIRNDVRSTRDRLTRPSKATAPTPASGARRVTELS
jgi:hypothetical protein